MTATVITDPDIIESLRAVRRHGSGRIPSADTQALLDGEVLFIEDGVMRNHRWYGMAIQRGKRLRTVRRDGGVYVWMEAQP